MEMLLASLTELHSRVGTVEKDEYDRLRRITDEDRMKAEHARLEIERHVARFTNAEIQCQDTVKELSSISVKRAFKLPGPISTIADCTENTPAIKRTYVKVSYAARGRRPPPASDASEGVR
jgi:hypothetical protein